MLRHLALALAATCLAFLTTPAAPAFAQSKEVVGPSRIYFADADTMRVLATKSWQSDSVRHQEKLLRHSLRLAYWRDRIPSDMRRVFDELGYPTGRILARPVGHIEEAWYYGQLATPLRFRDGVLLDAARFEALRTRR
ncbi:MAG: hypothetical protein AAB011_09940 [Candidatus Eisenbacteria bacterium]